MKNIIVCFLAALSFAAVANPSYIEYTVPAPAGGAPDIIARAIAEDLQKSVGIPVTVINKFAGGQYPATREFNDTKPSSKIMSITGTILSHTVIPANDSFNPIEDLDIVGPIAVGQAGLIVNKSSKHKNFKEFIEYARVNEVNCGSVRPLLENGLRYINDTYKTKLVLVPFKSTNDTRAAMLAKTVDCTVDIYAAYRPLIQSDTVEMLAVFHKDKVNTDIPVMPGNHPQIDSTINIALHKDMDPALKEKILAAIAGLPKSQEFVNKMHSLGYSVPGIEKNYKATLRKQFKLLQPIRDKAVAAQ